ncbi:MAG TPA: hypothetical protein VGC09_23020, partial [Rhodopila sp.]
PNTLTRGTVLGNSAGTTARLNFTGATKVFNDIPAERSVYADGTGAVTIGSSSFNGSGRNLLIQSDGTGGYSAQVGYLGPNKAMYTRVNQTTGDFSFVNGSYTSEIFRVQQNGGFYSPFGGSRIDYQGSAGLFINDSGGISGQSALILEVGNTGSFLAAFFYGTTGVGAINTNGSTTLYGTTSDYRLKVVYGPAADAGTIIDNVPVYDAEMKYGMRRPMFLAHELQAVVPDAVIGAKDAVRADGSIDPQLVDEKVLMPIVWASEQEVRARLATLEALVPTLIARITALENRPPNV